MSENKLPIGVCIKVEELRKRGYSNLQEWCDDPKHILVTRNGRVFYKDKNGERRIFAYKSSKWHNPFKVKDHGLEKSLEMFEDHLIEKLRDEKDLKEFMELMNYKEIGCFCNPREKCHRDIIIKFLVKRAEDA